MRHLLSPYPGSPPSPVQRLEVEVSRREGRIDLVYTLAGDPDGVLWPAPDAGGRTDELWRTTCFEAFVTTPEGYVEFNLSPSGRWASYAFDGYRTGMRPAAEAVQVAPLSLTGARATQAGTVELPAGARRLGLSAVIEAADGTRTYWALAHPSDKPDFHHPDSFVLDLP